MDTMTLEKNTTLEAGTTPCAEAQTLAADLHKLLERHKTTLDGEGVRHEVKTLECWLDSYCRGQMAASHISETGPAVLSDLRDRLKLAAEERLRLEGEGGNPPSKQQAQETEEMLSAIRRLEKLIPNIEQLFATN